MRQSVLFLALVPVAWLACISSENAAPPPQGGFDASSSVGEPDASAPNGQPEASADVTVVDSPAEAAVVADAAVDAAASPVVVTVVGALGPEPGVSIVWGDATGAVVATSITGPQGTASQPVAGGMVTALLGTTSQPSPYTIMGIQPGDQLVILDRGSVALLPVAPSVSLGSLPPSPPAGTTGYAFYAGPCVGSFQALPDVISLTQSAPPQNCIGLGPLGASFGAAYPALVEAYDVTSGVLGFAFSKHNPLTAPDDAGQIELALSGLWSTATTVQTVVVQNEPEAGVSQQWVYYSEVTDGVMLTLPSLGLADGGQLPPGATLYEAHGGYADFVQTEVSFHPSTPGIDDLHAGFALASRAPAPSADGTTTIDMSPLETLPALVGTTIDSTVPAQPAVTWTTGAGTLAAVTGVMVTAQWSGADPESGTQNGAWTIVSPATSQTSLQAPKLPPALGAWAPVAGATFGISSVYAIQGGAVLPGYAQLRAASSLFYLQTSCIFPPMIPPLPAAGTLMLSAFTSGACP